ncbi:ADP-ribosylation factor-related protein 1 isoform X1 [Chaetodon trifascialis]|uniref:ADP-ribosylation factor-related protein 1 isoform X1 n=1 Tax=Chaetodon trifascialis TaxID=109706 RepID=UPI0039938252
MKSEKQISRTTAICKKLVCHFSHSWKKRVALEEAQKRFELPNHGLITECQTRWGSRLAMIDRILEQKKALAEVLSEDTKTRHLVLGYQELDVLESVSSALGPLLEFTDALSGEEYVSVSHLKPVLRLFNTTLLAPKEDDTDMTKSLKKKILEYLNSKYEDDVTQELLDVASFLDPRYKTQYISEDNVPIIKSRLVKEMKTLELKRSGGIRVEEPEVPLPPTKKKKTLASFLKSPTASATASVDPTATIEAELNSYLLAKPLDMDEDPLLWWKKYQENYPRLIDMARKYLCVPATSSPSERVFSAGGNIVSCERSCLAPDMVNKLVFLAKNL